MKYLKLFEEFDEVRPSEIPEKRVKLNNQEGSGINEDDIIECITSGGVIYAETIQGINEIDEVEHNKKDPLKPESVDNKSVTVTIQNHKFEVEFNDIIKIEY